MKIYWISFGNLGCIFATSLLTGKEEGSSEANQFTKIRRNLVVMVSSSVV